MCCKVRIIRKHPITNYLLRKKEEKYQLSGCSLNYPASRSFLLTALFIPAHIRSPNLASPVCLPVTAISWWVVAVSINIVVLPVARIQVPCVALY